MLCYGMIDGEVVAEENASSRHEDTKQLNQIVPGALERIYTSLISLAGK